MFIGKNQNLLPLAPILHLRMLCGTSHSSSLLMELSRINLLALLFAIIGSDDDDDDGNGGGQFGDDDDMFDLDEESEDESGNGGSNDWKDDLGIED